jgi:sulfur-oxidizing protein SoxB
MVRVGGMQYTIDPAASAGNRISDMRIGDKPIEASKSYKVAGWAPVSEAARDAGGEPIWDVMATYLRQIKKVAAKTPNLPVIKGAANNPGMAG